MPDLLLVDGGKGQLSRAIAVLEHFNLQDRVHLAALAKQNEELFVPSRGESILLPRQSQGLFLIQRVRDEAHRFAITSHRKQRTRTGLASQLDAIPGIGPARRKALLSHFGNIQKIKDANLEDLMALPGINEQIANAIKSHLE